MNNFFFNRLEIIKDNNREQVCARGIFWFYFIYTAAVLKSVSAGGNVLFAHKK